MKRNLFLMGMRIFIFTFLSLLLGGTTPGTVQAQTKPTVASFQCTIYNIATVQVVEATNFPEEDRIYVQCANSPGGNLSSFASAVGTNPGIAHRYLVVLNTAMALGKTVTVFYDINSANNPVGCQSFDCRKLTGLVLGP
jgi:hypothetical protein